MAFRKSIKFSPDGNFYYCHDGYLAIRVFKLGNPDPIGRMNILDSCNPPVFSSDSKSLFILHYSQFLEIYYTWRLNLLDPEPGFVKNKFSIDYCDNNFITDNRYLININSRYSVELRDMRDGRQKYTPFTPSDRIVFVEIINEGIITIDLDKGIKLWSPEGKLLLEFTGADSDGITLQKLSPNKSKLLTVSDDLFGVKIWDIKSGKYLLSLLEPSNFIRDCLFYTENLLLTAGDDSHVLQEIHIWDLVSRSLLERINCDFPIYGIALHPNRKLLALAGDKDDISFNINIITCVSEYLEFDFYGINFSEMSAKFKSTALTFLICCKHNNYLAQLPRDMIRLILVYLSYKPWNSEYQQVKPRRTVIPINKLEKIDYK